MAASAEFIHDFGTNYTEMLGTLEDNHLSLMGILKSLFWWRVPEPEPPKPEPTRMKSLDPSLIKVRDTICVVGHDTGLVQNIKERVSALVDEPLPIESLHIRQDTDINSAALLVPKIILVASHSAGRKLLDDTGDEGILDAVYDEICDIGADLLVVYVGLPRAIYPPTRHMVYHPRMAQLLFPTQPTLRSLAETYSLVTLTENTDFTSMQKNVIREWLSRPVGDDHPVYNKAHEMLQYSFSEAEFLSESEIYRYNKPVPYYSQTHYLTATEDHPLAEEAERRKKKKKKTKKSRDSNTGEVGVLIDLDQENMELEMYNGETRDNDQLLVGSFTV